MKQKIKVKNNHYSINIKHIPFIETDFAVLGAGLAGLNFAFNIPEGIDALVLTKGKFEDSNSYIAQGGIASALAEDDSAELHIKDTEEAADGLGDKDTIKILCDEGLIQLKKLIEEGLKFDEDDAGNLILGLEGAHSKKRIAHINGDQTGRGLCSFLKKKLSQKNNVRILEYVYAVDILVSENQFYGVVVYDINSKNFLLIKAKCLLISSGGLGGVYRETTNNYSITGGGAAAALRAGCVLKDMEFIQFHPTVLYVPGAPRFLISEAVRGEGAHLLNCRGERFMENYSSLKELAPRDIVSRAIENEIIKTNASAVYLSLKHLNGDTVKKRFPMINSALKEYKINFVKDNIPVRPAAHYSMGGIEIDIYGRTAVGGIFAAGEAAASGVHGANRLASNSLLECLVFSSRAFEASMYYLKYASKPPMPPCPGVKLSLHRKFDFEDIHTTIRSFMWKSAGIFRTGKNISAALETLSNLKEMLFDVSLNSAAFWESVNMLDVSEAVLKSALLREESRGAHWRVDFPEKNEKFQKHITIEKE